MLIAGQIVTSVTRQKLARIRTARNDLRRQAELLIGVLQAAAKPFLLANVVLTVLVSFLISAPRIYRTPAVAAFVSQHGGQSLIAIVILAAGLAAYWSKRKFLLQYGIGEIIFGFATAYSVSGNLAAKDAMLSRWTALGGAIYVVSRGMGNIMDARGRNAVKHN